MKHNMNEKIMYIQLIVLLTTSVAVLSFQETEEIFIDSAEGPQLLNGFTVYDQFRLYNEKFIVEKQRAATSFIAHHLKVPFAELFSNMRITDYISIIILHSLYTENTNSLPCLAEFASFVNKAEPYEEENDWLRQNIKFPSEKSFLVVKSLVHLNNKGIANLPSPMLKKIISILDMESAFETAVEAGNEEVISWISELDIIHFKHLNRVVSSALYENRTDIVKLLIEKGALDVVSRDENAFLTFRTSTKNETLLHLAAQLHRPVAVAALLELGMPPNVEDIDGYTPLHRAVEANDEKTAALLVREGADVNLPNLLGDLPLHIAVTKGNLKMTKLLIKLGSSLDRKNNLGFTPLYVAENTVVAAIIRYMEDMRWQNQMKAAKNNGEYPCNGNCSEENPTSLNSIFVEKVNDFFTNLNLREVFCHDNDLQFVNSLSEIVNLFLRKGEVSRMPSYLQMLLSIKANKIRNEEISEILINLGYDTPDMNIEPILDSIEDINAAFMSFDENVKFRNKTGHTHLHEAASEGNLKVVKALVSKGADIEAETINSWTPLHFAASKGHEDVVSFLIKNEASIDAKAFNEETPLHLASANNHVGVVRILIESDAEINAEMSPNCMTPLYVASTAGHLKVVEVLVAGKASLTSKDCGNYNLTPLQVAALNGRVSTVRFLAHHGADIDARDNQGNTALYTAAYNGLEEIVKTLVELDASLNLRVGKIGFTALHAAAWRGHAKVAEILLEGGADPDSRDQYQATPLYWATNLEVAKTLIYHDASVNARTVNGETPLHKASSIGRADIVEELIRSGAEIDAKTTDGKTPAYEAILQNQFNALKILVEKGANLYAVGPNGYTVLNLGISKGMFKMNNG